MSKEGAPSIRVEADGMRVAIIAGSWHEQVMSGLISAAEKTVQEAGCEYDTIRVAGAFELPVVAKTALSTGYEAVICLGVVIRGGTPHFEYVCNAVTDGLTRVALDTGRAVGFGVLTVDDEDQAIDRAGLPGSAESKGKEAAEAAISTALAIRSLFF